MTLRSVVLGCAIGAAVLLTGCSSGSNGAAGAVSTAPSTYSGPAAPSIEPDMTATDAASVESIGSFVLRHLSFHDRWSGGSGPNVSAGQVAASTVQAWKAFSAATTFSETEFTSLFERISPYYQTGFEPVLVDAQRAADADHTLDNTAVRYFLEGTDDNYVITMSMTHESGAWRVVRFEPEDTSAHSATEVASPPPSATSSAPTGPGPSQDAAITVSTSTGKTVEIDLSLQAPVRASDAAVAWKAVNGKDDIPCVADATSDAVVVGTLSLTNTTPDYPSSIYVNFKSAVTGGSIEVGASYANGNQCITQGSDGWEGSAIQPHWTDATWGPTPIAFVVHDYFGPSVADGDASRLPSVTTLFGSTSSDSYTVKSASGLFSPVGGLGASLDLAGLG